MMLYPTWHPLPRPPSFPEDPQLDRLVADYEPTMEGFRLRMKRRNARDLRKGIFGPKGSRDVPDQGGGVMAFELPKGWRLRLTYHETSGMNAGDVDAEFISPARRQVRVRRQREAAPLAEAHA